MADTTVAVPGAKIEAKENPAQHPITINVPEKGTVTISGPIEIQGEVRTISEHKPIWHEADTYVASFTLLLAFVTAVLAWYTAMLRKETKSLADDAKHTASEQFKRLDAEFTATHRPWISLNCNIAGPLSYDATGWDAGIRWHVQLQYVLKNIGKTPAVDVEFHANILPFIIPHFPEERIKNGIPQGPPEPGTDVAAELKKLCDAIAGMNEHLGALSGNLLFPGDQTTGRFHINGNPAVFDAAKKSEGTCGNFVLLVCATYKTTIDSKFHHTGKAFALFKQDAPPGTGRSINLEGEIIPADQLAIAPQPHSRSYAT